NAATSVEKIQLCSGSYTWVHVMAQSFTVNRTVSTTSGFRGTCFQSATSAITRRGPGLSEPTRTGAARRAPSTPLTRPTRDRRLEPALPHTARQWAQTYETGSAARTPQGADHDGRHDQARREGHLPPGSRADRVRAGLAQAWSTPRDRRGCRLEARAPEAA